LFVQGCREEEALRRRDEARLRKEEARRHEARRRRNKDMRRREEDKHQEARRLAEQEGQLRLREEAQLRAAPDPHSAWEEAPWPESPARSSHNSTSPPRDVIDAHGDEVHRD
jgi:hypothetical protein